ncbi:YaaC family protein [Bacillus stercoris]|uniref:YaaC family protein n=1 Tax=Bacillus TaxID=1386 RepID=UPI00249CE932|nr:MULTISPECIES: YaaC family protein [Bacillus]MDN0193410.1 YaaC family protein [Bacillus sp. B.PNR1]MDN3035425.1 YaaC family protein [Bacillus sp. B.PNR2]WGV95546.1 YaaC family protein [Bacillus stercoris]
MTYHEWKDLALFYSVESTQKFLEKVYNLNGIDDAKKNSFKNSERFIYFLKHAESFYKQAAYSPLEIKPILLFYGMAQLIKACLITRDPHYPSHTSVLAHGVTTRKRKKQNYCFSDDEVKIQRNGLCVHFMKHLFGQSDIVDERYTMKKLLMGIPELSDIFYFQQKERFMTKVEKNKNKIFVPEEVVIDYKMSDSRFVEYMSHHFQWSFAKKNEHGLLFEISPQDKEPWTSTSLLFDMEKNQYYIPSQREQFLRLPEMTIHYLILYNVGMIARYETEWWYELLTQHISDDYVLIQQFLLVTEKKFPKYASQFLLHS